MQINTNLEWFKFNSLIFSLIDILDVNHFV
jgi:hypothetical protein